MRRRPLFWLGVVPMTLTACMARHTPPATLVEATAVCQGTLQQMLDKDVVAHGEPTLTLWGPLQRVEQTWIMDYRLDGGPKRFLHCEIKPGGSVSLTLTAEAPQH
jgi:hypothetical protein